MQYIEMLFQHIDAIIWNFIPIYFILYCHVPI